MQHLLDHISPIFKISDAGAIEALEAMFVQKHFAKNELLIEEGQTCRHLYFLEKGAVRGFYNIDGKDVSQWFGFENDFVTSFRSFITRTATKEYIQVVEDAVLWCVSKDQLDQLLKTYPELEKMIRLIYEQYYIRLEERYSNAHFKTATERYEDLATDFPHILQRMPLGYIASYLGISAETLSRIRKSLE
jgi:CRP-like cAMP-binding protein